MSFKFDLSKFKKISSDKHSTLMRHEDGHEMKLNHASLEPKHREMLAAMPAMDKKNPKKMADGGDVQSDEDSDKNKDYVAKKYHTSEHYENDDMKPQYYPAPPPGINTNPSSGRAHQAVSDYFQGKAEGGEIQSEEEFNKNKDYVANKYRTNESVPKEEIPSQFYPEQPSKGGGGGKGGKAHQAVSDYFNGMADGGEAGGETASTGSSMGQNPMEQLTDDSDKPAPADSYAAASAPPQRSPQSVAPAQAPIVVNVNNGPAPVEPTEVQKQLDLQQKLNPGQPSQMNMQAAQSAANRVGATEQGIANQGNNQPPANTRPTSGPNDPFGTEAYNHYYMQGLNQQVSGINHEAQAIGKQGQQDATVYGNAGVAQRQLVDEFNGNVADLNGEIDGVIKDIKDQHIDANHYLTHMSTPGRIATAIGLMFGGSDAMNFLNNQIANDIKGQELNLGKSNTLLGAYYKQFGNLKDATDMTRAVLQNITAGQIQQTAAKMMDPLAKARGELAIGKLKGDAASTLSQIAMKRTLLNGMNRGQVPAEAVVRMIVPDHEKAAAYKELAEAQQLVKVRDNLLNAFDQIAQINTVYNRATSPVDTARRVAALRDPLIPGLSKETAGRYTESDANAIGSLYNTLGGDAKTLALQRAQLDKIASEKLNFPILESYGIHMGQTGRYNQQGASRIPESALVKKK